MRHGVAIVGALGVVLALTGCNSDSGDGGGGGEVKAGCESFADYGTFDGASVNVYSSIRDIEAERFEESFKQFEDCTGIDIVWEGTGEFEAQLQVRVDGGNAPDIATIPQPGLLKTLVDKGAVKPAAEKVKTQSEANYPKDWLDYGTVAGTFYAPPLGANVKSFVWYSPKTFTEKGWQIPTTWAELKTLSDTIAGTGIKPWCAGIESGDATGWPATDWVEDLVLRTAGTEVYDQWVTHEVPFNAPQIVTAVDEAGSILKNDKYVNGGFGGVKSIATTAFQDAGLPILDGKCALHRQASFFANQWPEGTKVAEDGDVYAFYLPGQDTSSKPVLGGGEFLAAFNDKPETQAVQLYFGSESWVNAKAKIGDWFTANNKLDVANVANPIDKLSVQLLQDPETVFRFDGSDMMPGAVGAGSFWKGMTDWITGKSTADTLKYIEDSWPKS
ncbi:MAG: carbohydrate ABC transporter substrate-binding protein [Actinomycetales bacterium]|nr:carbohydrate ABC transporter substrate-binding protein [Actinomycetales bacterium]